MRPADDSAKASDFRPAILGPLRRLSSHPRWCLLAVLTLAAILRGGFVIADSQGLSTDPDGYHRVAANLAEHGIFGERPQQIFPAEVTDPGDFNAAARRIWSRNEPILPTAYRPPLYPLLLVPGHWLGIPAAWAGGLNLLLGLATVGLAFAAMLRWTARPAVAAAAGLLVACDPILLNGATLPMTETLAAFLLLLGWAGLSFLAASRRQGDRRLLAAGLALGLVGGLAILCRPSFLPVALVLGVTYPAIIHRAGRWKLAAAMVAGLALALTPWAARNAWLFGQPILGTTHGGYTLHLANNPDYFAHVQSRQWDRPWDAAAFNRRYRDRRMAAFNRWAADPTARHWELQADSRETALAAANIDHQPGAAFMAAAAKLGKFWRPWPHQRSADETLPTRAARLAVGGWYLAIFGLAIFGGVLGIRDPHTRTAWPLALVLVVGLSLVHALFWSDLRMRAPLMPLVACWAAVGAGQLGSLLNRRLTTPGGHS